MSKDAYICLKMSTMKKEELELLLKDVVTPISKIEAELKMPKTTLQKALKGTRGLSKKWSLALVKWVTYEEAPTTKRSEPVPAAVEKEKPAEKKKDSEMTGYERMRMKKLGF